MRIAFLHSSAPVAMAFFWASVVSCPFADTAAAAEGEITDAERRHWAFQPVERPRVPPVAEHQPIRTPIDAFIVHRLEKQGFALSPPAGRRQLLRRAALDLTGLPPTPDEINQFVADRAPDAYDRLIDRLLASPAYGETWGRMWLDLVRFAETAGFNADPARPLAYKYRDYVIRAFNQNKPYDRFVQEQLAGDELFPHSPEALIATGYNRMWPDESNASDVLLARQDALNDLTGNVGAVYMGLSIACAQCHDHKFDPILQSDFYELQSFFAGIVLKDRVPIGTTGELSEYRRRLEQWRQENAGVRDELHKIEQTARAKSGRIKRLKFPQIVLDAIDTAPEKRTAFQHQVAFWSERQIEVDEKKLLAQLNDKQKKRREELKKQLAKLQQDKPQPPARAQVMATVEVPSGPATTHVLSGGAYEYPENEVQPAYLTILSDGENRVADVAPPRSDTSGRRSALARWLTDGSHPLTARVMVNRIWQGHFGQGIVANANDFGTQTSPPSHPKLLDWLAAEFVSSGWDVKHLHRLIMTSAVYRQRPLRTAGDGTLPPANKTDPDNLLLWHYPRRRLSAERIRDSLLSVAGRLVHTMYGPGVKPTLPPNFSKREAWKVTDSATERNRRSIYIYAKRNLPYPMLKSFDFPDMHEACGRRAQTTIAPQALMLLNSQLILDCAQGVAGRVLAATDDPGDPTELVRRTYSLTVGREPDKDELAMAADFLKQQESLIAKRLAAGQKTTLPPGGPSGAGQATASALVDLCHVMVNANEFLFVE